ncbi:transposase IS4 family protein [Caldicellulosiruptor owensensis OL]|uniref:Transposase IS4 family protein n=1 Tax=Caldicellulosiruptor owensensis (strain ATCC 700167 / DSM 13100 / OL) TaxID=632518 RepID=E4Q5V2_CALOW|nr:IS1182 family transposase [Caldicellulosiruptor owensensis]ADQ05511.1 transposase IS4 family protein [Caldicellulosiruptor owensensis OL]
MPRKHDKIVFKEYNPNQLIMPIDPEAFIPQTHLVRAIDKIVDKIDISTIIEKYKGGGTSSYHPLMLLKVLIYAYIQGIYSSRKIAKALQENITFMWLSKLQTPDFRTINRFRKEIIGDCIEEIFAEVIELLVKLGYVNFEYYYLDGTKIEANANKYTFVWAKSTRTYKRKLREKVKNILDEIERINEEEDRTLGELDVNLEADYDSQELEQKVEELSQKLAEASFGSKRKERRVKKLVKTLQNDCILRLKKYESYEQILSGRNSFSKTDHDATFMRMKDDHMKNGMLKPGYNVQIGTQNRFVIGFSIHQSPTDTVCLKEHLELVEKITGHMPKNVIADSGYGSEENYLHLKKCGINSYIKYNTFDLEQTRKFKKDKFNSRNWEYIASEDVYICPAGKKVKYLYPRIDVNERGFVSWEKIYQCEEVCNGCEYRDKCYRGKRWKKRFRIRPRLEKLKNEVRERLLSEEGKEIYSRRKIEVETVFGLIKNNKGFRRFLLRGLKGVKLEWGLVCIAYNIERLAKIIIEGWGKIASQPSCFLLHSSILTFNAIKWLILVIKNYCFWTAPLI